MGTNTDAARLARSRRFAGRVVDRALARSDSILTGRRGLWNAAACRALTESLEAAARDGEGRFAARWATLLHGLDDALLRLAIEVLAVHLWYPSDVRPQTKVAYLADTAAHLSDPFRLSSHARAGITAGVAGSGISYGIRRLSQLAFVTRSAAALSEGAGADRHRVLTDPWRWKRHLWSVPVVGGSAQREVLLHLVHPDVFEPIVSPRVKQQIVRAHAHAIPVDVTDVDAQLAVLRHTVLADDPTRPLRDLLSME